MTQLSSANLSVKFSLKVVHIISVLYINLFPDAMILFNIQMIDVQFFDFFNSGSY